MSLLSAESLHNNEEIQWNEFKQQIKKYVLFPSLTTLDLSNNRICKIPPSIALLNQLAVLNISGNKELQHLPIECSTLNKLWNLNLKGCRLTEPLKNIVESDHYRTSEILALLRNKLENSKLYPKLKLMVVGSPGVGKSALLQMMRQEGQTRKNNRDETWATRMGHSPTRIPTFPHKSSANLDIVDISEWCYQPKKSSRSASSTQNKTKDVYEGRIIFRTWDFVGITQKECHVIEQCFFTRRCLYLLIWRVTDGELGVSELHDTLFRIQTYASNSNVLIVGTHLDHIRDNLTHFPSNYLRGLDDQIQRRFINVVDAEKKGLPRVLGSLYISSRSREDIRSLCQLVYQCAAEIRNPTTKTRLVEEYVPASFIMIEKIVVSLVDEYALNKNIPIIKKEDLWSILNEKNILQHQRQSIKKNSDPSKKPLFNDINDLHKACKFLHHNGVICYYDSFQSNDIIFLDPRWLCSFLTSLITSETTFRRGASIHELAVNSHGELEKRFVKFFRILDLDPKSNLSRTLRHALFGILYTYSIAHLFTERIFLFPSFLPDEYLLRAEYPGAKVKVKGKHNKWIPRWRSAQSNGLGAKLSRSETTEDVAPFRNVEHKRLTRMLAYRRDSMSTKSLQVSAKISSIETQTRESIRRLFMLQYIPSGFWPRLITRLLDCERFNVTLEKLFVVNQIESEEHGKFCHETSSANLYAIAQVLNTFKSAHAETTFIQTAEQNLIDEHLEFEIEINEVPETNAETNGFEWVVWQTGVEVRSFGDHILLSLKQFLPLASITDVNYSIFDLQRRSDGHWSPLFIDQGIGSESSSTAFIIELLIPNSCLRVETGNSDIFEVRTNLSIASRLLALITSILDDLLEDWFPALGTRGLTLSDGTQLVDRLIPCNSCATEAINMEEDKRRLKHMAKTMQNRDASGSSNTLRHINTSEKFRQIIKDGTIPKSKSVNFIPKSFTIETENKDSLQKQHENVIPLYLFSLEECILEARNYNKKFVAPMNEFESQNVLSTISIANEFVCPRHKDQQEAPDLTKMAPDLLFSDFKGHEYFISSYQIKKGKLIGRGAFGFVFNGWISNDLGQGSLNKVSHFENVNEAALKVLEPLSPETLSLAEEHGSVQVALQAFLMKWRNNPSENVAKAYCTARQELEILLDLRHLNIISLLGFCPHPTTLLFELAPYAALDQILVNYKRCSLRLHSNTLQLTLLQIARALEYLHGSKIIYRDLKSGNVLVWKFPLPPTCYAPANVLVKLGDYGISRHVYSSGQCKGYGGTEAFMAPEVLSYGGEHEYTNRVDIFSFGMLIYELIMLKPPYDGQERMKEHILECRRPHVTEKELLYPTNILDLMINCWSEQPELRPSASELTLLCCAPELAHCLDVSLLSDDEQFPPISTVIITDMNEKQINCCTIGLRTDENFQMVLLSFSQFGWIDKKIEHLKLDIGKSSKCKRIGSKRNVVVTALHQFDDDLWVGDSDGRINIYNVITFEKLYEFSTSTLFQQADEAVCEREVPARSVIRISAFPERRIVVVALPYTVLLCQAKVREDKEVAEQREEQVYPPPLFLTSIQLKKDKIFSIGILPSLTDWQIWTGHGQGRIFAHHISSSGKLTFSSSITHTSTNKDEVFEPGNVSFIVPSTTEKNIVWSALEDDNRIFMWKNGVSIKVLNCSKILPPSEPTSNLGIFNETALVIGGELNATPGIRFPHSTTNRGGQYYITAIAVVNLLSRQEYRFSSRTEADRSFGNKSFEKEQLVIGTNRGVIIIADAKEMIPLSSCRPYFGRIECILPCTIEIFSEDTEENSPTLRVLQNELSATMQQDQALMQRPKWRSFMYQRGKPSLSTYLLGTSTKDGVEPTNNERNVTKGIFPNKNEDDKGERDGQLSEGFYITMGENYRPLLDRSAHRKSDKKTNRCAIFWRTTDHWDLIK